jgi:hypothetical protein
MNNKEMQMVEAYEAPQVRVVLARVEKGFAVSGDSSATITDWDSANF